mgnify:FL=1
MYAAVQIESLPFKVVCINNVDRPNEVPLNLWPEVGQPYTVVKMDKLKTSGGIGFKLAELNTDGCFPFTYFVAERFAIIPSV